MTSTQGALRIPERSQYAGFLRLLCIFYLLGAISYLIFPSDITSFLNIGSTLGRGYGMGSEIPEPVDRFWIVQAAIHLFLLSAISLMASFSPSALGYNLIHLAAKVASIGGYGYILLNHPAYFAYIFAIGLEIFIACSLLWIWLRASRAMVRKQSPEPGIPEMI